MENLDQIMLYVSSLSLPLIAMVILFICNLRFWQPKYFNYLSMCYLLTMLSILVDISWRFIEGKPNLIYWNHFTSIAESCCFGFTGFCWLMHSFNMCKPPIMKTHRHLVTGLALIPVLLVQALMLMSISTGWIYSVDSGGHYVRGPLISLRYLGYAYLMLASANALQVRRQTDVPSLRHHYLIVSCFCLPPVILGTIQLCVPTGTMPTNQFSIFLSLFILYVEDQNIQITRDALTKLRNRTEFERIAKDKIAHYKFGGTKQLYLLGADLNKFKAINDTFGHLEGDRALKLTADTLSNSAEPYGGIVARMSGDEFSILLETENPEIPDYFIAQVRRKLTEVSENEPFHLSISIGVAEYDGLMNLKELLDEADKKMYQVKHNKV